MINVIEIIGTGYVGLVTGVCFADKGYNVICYDKERSIINNLRKGQCHFFEKNLGRYLKKAILKKKINFEILSQSTKFKSNLIFITVGTPFNNGKIDLRNITNVSKIIGKNIKNTNKFVSVVIKSTVIPSTTDSFVRKIIEKISKKKIGQFGLGMNPEFLREGSAIEDFIYQDRIIIGYEDNKTLQYLKKLYTKWNCEKILMSTRSAEMSKYANNVLLASQISIVNELANISLSIGKINFSSVIKSVHLDKRWNPKDGNKRTNPGILNYLQPGGGFGGSCFSKDLKSISKESKRKHYKTPIIDSVLKINEMQPFKIIDLLLKNQKTLKNKKILILGLSFKPNTDDLRESVSLKLINGLIPYKAKLILHDPKAMTKAKKIIKKINNITFTNNWKKDINFVDIILIITQWSEYKQLTNPKYKKSISNKIIFDTRGFFNQSDFNKSKYLSIG